MDQQDWADYEAYCEQCANKAKTPNSFPVWEKMSRGINSGSTTEVNRKPAQQPEPAGGDRAAELAGVADRLASESVMLAMEIAEALGLDRETFLDADGPDAIVEAIEAQRKELATARAALAAANTRIEWCDEILDGAEKEAPKDWPGDEEYEVDHSWYMIGVYVREYRAEYPKAQQPTGDGSVQPEMPDSVRAVVPPGMKVKYVDGMWISTPDSDG